MEKRFTTTATAPLSKTLTDLEGAQPVTGRTPPASLESSALPPSPLHRRSRRRQRRRHAGHDLTAPLVAAFERISINEPEMAGSSSTGGSEGPLLSLSLCISCRSKALVLRTKERSKKLHSICTLCRSKVLTNPTPKL